MKLPTCDNCGVKMSVITVPYRIWQLWTWRFRCNKCKRELTVQTREMVDFNQDLPNEGKQ